MVPSLAVPPILARIHLVSLRLPLSTTPDRPTLGALASGTLGAGLHGRRQGPACCRPLPFRAWWMVPYCAGVSQPARALPQPVSLSQPLPTDSVVLVVLNERTE